MYGSGPGDGSSGYFESGLGQSNYAGRLRVVFLGVGRFSAPIRP